MIGILQLYITVKYVVSQLVSETNQNIASAHKTLSVSAFQEWLGACCYLWFANWKTRPISADLPEDRGSYKYHLSAIHCHFALFKSHAVE